MPWPTHLCKQLQILLDYIYSYENLVPKLGIIGVNKQVHREVQTAFLRENTVHFKNIAPGIPTGQSLDLLNQATEGKVWIVHHLKDLDEVVALLVAHMNLYSVRIRIAIEPAMYVYNADLYWDSTRSEHEEADADFDAETDRWCASGEIRESLWHLPTRDGIRVDFLLDDIIDGQ